MADEVSRMDANAFLLGDLSRRYSLSSWRTRTALDALGAARIPRPSGLRILPASMLPEFEAEIRRRGWLKEPVPVPTHANS
jgi:hypothetical protein